jgi:hypothetical protein
MPELPVKEVRPSELRLPEIKREQIIRSLSEMRLPALDRPDIERPRIPFHVLGGRVDWRAIDPTSIDVSKAIAAVAAATRFGRPAIRRSRATLAVGTLVVVGLAAAALLASPAVRERAGRTARSVRIRMDGRGGSADLLEVDADVTVEPVEVVGVAVAAAVADAPTPPPVASLDADVEATVPVPDEVASPA